jgi:uncharacterized protein DUF3891
MIVQELDRGLLLFRQTDHALLSGAFAAAWGNSRMPSFDHRDGTLVAASCHDDGWAEWELAPTLLHDGRPTDFIRIPLAEHTALYRHGIDLVEAEDAYGGLVASLHGERLYTRPFEPGMDPRIERLKGDDLKRAKEYTQHEQARQERLLEALGNPTTHAEEAWRLLQVWDRLSLLVCMQPVREGTQRKLPPVASRDGDVNIEARATNDGDVVLDPFPFAEDPAPFAVEAFVTARSTWDDVVSFRRDVRLAPRTTISFRCRSA